MCVVHNIKQAVKQGNQTPYGDSSRPYFHIEFPLYQEVSFLYYNSLLILSFEYIYVLIHLDFHHIWTE